MLKTTVERLEEAWREEAEDRYDVDLRVGALTFVADEMVRDAIFGATKIEVDTGSFAPEQQLLG